MKVNQDSATPTRKVGLGAVAGALTIIIVWVASDFGGIDVPAEVASAFTAILTFATSYFVKDTE